MGHCEARNNPDVLVCTWIASQACNDCYSLYHHWYHAKQSKGFYQFVKYQMMLSGKQFFVNEGEVVESL